MHKLACRRDFQFGISVRGDGNGNWERNWRNAVVLLSQITAMTLDLEVKQWLIERHEENISMSHRGPIFEKADIM